MIYFIQSGQSGPIKIGYSKDERTLARRVNNLQVAHPEPIFILHTMPGDEKDEECIHRELNQWHKRGEWFEPSAPVLDAIDAAKKGEAIAPGRTEPNWTALARISWKSYLWNSFRIRACSTTGEVNQKDYTRFLNQGGLPDDLPPYPQNQYDFKRWKKAQDDAA